MDQFLRRLIPYLAYGHMTVVGWTTRVRWEGLEHVQDLKRHGQNFIYAFWHNRQVLFTYTHRGDNVAILVSQSKDGDLIADVMRLSKIGGIRGSSSRGALAASRELIRAAESGVHVGVTPDGPRGPRYEVKPGVLYVAQQTGLPIIPITNATSRKIVLARSWDQYQVPMPFARAAIVHGPPIYVRETDNLEAKAAELQKSMLAVTARAEELVA